MYEYPPEIEPSAKLPRRLEEKLDIGQLGKVMLFLYLLAFDISMAAAGVGANRLLLLNFL